MCSDHKSRLQYLWQMSSSRLAPINDRTMLMAGRKSAFGKQLQEMSPTDKNISNRQTSILIILLVLCRYCPCTVLSWCYKSWLNLAIKYVEPLTTMGLNE